MDVIYSLYQAVDALPYDSHMPLAMSKQTINWLPMHKSLKNLYSKQLNTNHGNEILKRCDAFVQMTFSQNIFNEDWEDK